MIQIYMPENTDFEQNGDFTLMPISCTVKAGINTAWSLTMSHPIDEEGRYKTITEGAVIKAPSFNGEQLFRIKRTDISDSGVNAEADPIFLDAADDCLLMDVRPTNVNGQQALNIITEGSKYSGISNITKKSTAYYQLKNLIEALNGDDENSFTKRWGGEMFFDNYTVAIDEKIGKDNGVQVLYGKNTIRDGVREEVDTTSLVTRIIPKAFNGRMLAGSDPYIDSPILDKYPVIHTRVIEYPDVVLKEDLQGEPSEGEIICDTLGELYEELGKKVAAEYENGIDKPKVSISISMPLLENTEEYKKYKDVEEVSLGDTVHCKHDKLGVDTAARVVSLEYDCINERTIGVEIGETQYQYFNQISSTITRTEQAIRPDGTVIGPQIAGFIDGALAQLRLQNTIAKKQDVRAIIFEDLDPSSETFGAMALGTQGLQISRNRTADGRDWLWTTALTAKGLIANIIVAGLIADKTGKSFWDLDTGEFVLEDGTITGGKFITTDKDNGWGTQISGGIFDSTGEFSLNEKTYKTKLRIASGGISGTSEDEKGNYFGGFDLNSLGGSVNADKCQAFLTVIPNTVSISLNNSKYGHIGLSIDGVHKEPKIEIGDVELLPIQRGRFSTSVPAQSYADYTITFPVAFKGVPTVIPAFSSASTAHSFGRATLSTHSVTKSGCKIRVFNNDTTGRQPDVLWIATGK
jgi:phage minor structural protein